MGSTCLNPVITKSTGLQSEEVLQEKKRKKFSWAFGSGDPCQGPASGDGVFVLFCSAFFVGSHEAAQGIA